MTTGTISLVVMAILDTEVYEIDLKKETWK